MVVFESQEHENFLLIMYEPTEAQSVRNKYIDSGDYQVLQHDEENGALSVAKLPERTLTTLMKYQMN